MTRLEENKLSIDIDESNSSEKKLPKVIAAFARELFNNDTDVSMVYGDDENGKENYKIFKELLGMERLKGENIEVLQKVDKKIDDEHLLEAFLLKISKDGKNIYKNVTAVFELEEGRKVLKHVHISEPRMLNGEKVEDLGINKDFFKNYNNIKNISSEGRGKEVLPAYTKRNHLIYGDFPEYIATEMMEKYWADALLKGADEVVKLFSPKAFLKGTVVKGLRIGSENGIKDYFEHFCKRDPKMNLKKITTKWLKDGESILAYGEYLFELDHPKQEVPANFTMIFVKKDGRWMIDTLHSSIKYKKQDLEKLQ